MTEPTKRKPRELNAFELASRAHKSLEILDAQIAARAKSLKAAKDEREALIANLDPGAADLLRKSGHLPEKKEAKP
jgi:hypothetical protein